MIHKCDACDRVLSSRSAYTQHLRTKRHETRVLLYNVCHDVAFVPSSGVVGRPYLSESKTVEDKESKTVEDIVLELENETEEEEKPYTDAEDSLDIMELLNMLEKSNRPLDPQVYNHQVLKAYAMKCSVMLSSIQRNLYQLVLR